LGKLLRAYKKIRKSPHHKKELINYATFLLVNWKAPHFLKRLHDLFTERFLEKEIPSHYQHYLINVPNLCCQNVCNAQAPHYFSLPVSICAETNESESFKAFLATRPIETKHWPPWDQGFEDQEDIFSLHRFGWMLPLLANSPSVRKVNILIKLALNWIDENPHGTESIGWDSYSISERIVHWIFLISIARAILKNNNKAISRIVCSLKEQVNVLKKNLEFRGTATHNHLINNGRALYLAGIFLGDAKAIAIGKEILHYEIGHMFTLSGFLREGSSHYHILLCRTYLEVLWFGMAVCDYEFCDKLINRTKDIYNCARFLLNDGNLPLFGDVSPDFSPEFHTGLLEVGAAIFKKDIRASSGCSVGWHSLFVPRKYKKEEAKRDQSDYTSDDKSLIAYPDSGYYRFKNKNYCVFLYVNSLGYVPEWSHGHSDLGGFALYWHNEPVVIDVGRPTYAGTKLGMYARSVRAHNTISIDEFEPCVTHALNGFAQIIINDYFQPPPKVTVVRGEKYIKIYLELYGYQRINKYLVVKRTLSFYDEGLSIEDTIEGCKKHLVETFFHFAPGVEASQTNSDRIILSTPKGNKLRMAVSSKKRPSMDIVKGKDGSTPAGWFFPRYGKVVPTNTLIFSHHTHLPIHNRYVIDAG